MYGRYAIEAPTMTTEMSSDNTLKNKQNADGKKNAYKMDDTSSSEEEEVEDEEEDEEEESEEDAEEVARKLEE